MLAAPCAAQVQALAQAHTVPDSIAQRVQACTACHGKDGRASNQGYLPRIAGKPAGYLHQQLLNFRDGRRNNAAMQHLTANLGNAYLLEMAEYFSALDLPYPVPQTRGAAPAVLAHGERLVRHGDPARGLRACSSCHGKAMTGRLPAIPGLLGLPRDYVVAQLGAWQTGLRKAPAPDCMGKIAQVLTLDDVQALSAWLSSQAMPANSRAVPAPTAPADSSLACSVGTP